MSAFEFGKPLTAKDYDLLHGIDRQIIEQAGLRRVDSLEGGDMVALAISNISPQPAKRKRRSVSLKIPAEHAGLLRPILEIAFREAVQCSDPALFDGTGELQRMVVELYASVDGQLRKIEEKAKENHCLLAKQKEKSKGE